MTQGDAARDGLRDHLFSLHKAMFCETSPVPAKYAALLLGLCSKTARLPPAPLKEGNRRRMVAAIHKAKLLAEAPARKRGS